VFNAPYLYAENNAPCLATISVNCGAACWAFLCAVNTSMHHAFLHYMGRVAVIGYMFFKVWHIPLFSVVFMGVLYGQWTVVSCIYLAHIVQHTAFTFLPF